MTNTFPIEVGDRIAEFTIKTSREKKFVLGWNDSEELQGILDLLSELEPQDTFYDVGSHLGLYTCLVGQTNDVVCFEPHPETINGLRRNLEHNNIDADVHNIALADSDGSISFEPRIPLSGGMGRIDRKGISGITVDVRTLDSLMRENELQQPNIIKVDIDGEELNFLRGAREILSAENVR